MCALEFTESSSMHEDREALSVCASVALRSFVSQKYSCPAVRFEHRTASGIHPVQQYDLARRFSVVRHVSSLEQCWKAHSGHNWAVGQLPPERNLSPSMRADRCRRVLSALSYAESGVQGRKKTMAELQGFIFKTQALHLYRGFLRAVKGAPAGSQGKPSVASLSDNH